MSTGEQLWEAFWSDLPEGTGQAFWDCPAAQGVASHVKLFLPYFDRTIPLLDLGCGNGTQTRYLAGLFSQVIGADIAAAALARAREQNPAPNVVYTPLDMLDEEAVSRFHDRFGDVNVYLSGVLHQLPVQHRVSCARHLAILAGHRGRVFDQELTPASYTYMQELMADRRNDLPKLDRVSAYFRIGLQPAAGEAGLEAVFSQAGFTVLDSGDLFLRTTETMPDGTGLDLPTRYVIVGPAVAG